MARTRDLAAASTRLLFVGVLAMLVVCSVALQTQRKHHAHRHYRGLHGTKGRNTPSLKLSDDLTLTQAQVDELKTYLASKNKWFTAGDQTFWHWTTFENCLRWSREGRMSDDEMIFLNSQHASMAAGGGFYIAHDPRSSRSYGPCPVEVTIDGSSLILHEADLKDRTFQQKFSKGRLLANEELSKLGQLVPFVHNHGERVTEKRWWVTHSTKTIKRMAVGLRKFDRLPWLEAYGDRANEPHTLSLNVKITNVAEYFQALWGIRDAFEKRVRNGEQHQDLVDSANWLESFSHLLQYVDGISLVGGIRGPHAKDPWGIFEPQNFDKFRKVNQQIIKERLEKGGSIFNVSPTLGGKSFGEGMPLGKWMDDMLARLLSVYKAMSGEEISYRNHEVRAGGDEENGTFKATAEQVAALEANEFLVVHKKPTDDPDVFLVHYYYPDPLHRTPKTQFLVASLEKELLPEYPADKVLFKKHTVQIMEDLTKNVLLTTASKKVRVDYQGLAQLMIRLMSVHPCANFNGRSIRMFIFMLGLGFEKKIAPVGFITDFDLAMRPDDYAQLLQAQTAAYDKLRIGLLSNFIKGVSGSDPKKRMPSYFEDAELWDTFVHECLMWFNPKPMRITAQDWPLINKRQWIDLFDKTWDKRWRTRGKPKPAAIV